MARKCLLLMLVFSCSVAFGVNNYWIGGSGSDWHTAANWSEGHYPIYSSSETAYIGMEATDGYTVDYTESAVYYSSPYDLYLGRSTDPERTYTLNFASTAYCASVWSHLGSQGVININGGRYEPYGTYQLDGVVNINDGGLYLNRCYVWRIAGRININAGGTFQINNGSRFSETSTDITVPNSYFTGVINLCGGTMQMQGDCTTAIASHISSGNIRSHGNTGGVSYYYDLNTNKTYISATSTANYWTGAGDGVSWGSTSNWSEGSVPTSGVGYLGMNAMDDFEADYEGRYQSPDDFYLGRSIDIDPADTYILNIIENSAQNTLFYNINLFVYPKGVINVNYGTLNCYRLRQLDGEVNINDGTFTVGSPSWKIGGHVTVNEDGVLEIHNLQYGTGFSNCSSDITVPNSNFTGIVDLRGGEMQMDGDCTTAIAWHISNGNIQSYGGSSEVDYYYDSGSGQTIVTSTPIINYWRGGSGTDWHESANWSAGHTPDYSSSELTYLGMNATGDCTVDFAIYASYSQSPSYFYLGRDVDPTGTYTLNVKSEGSLHAIYSYIGSQGVINVNGGEYLTFGTPQLDGIVNINDGGIYINESYVWRIGGYVTVDADSYLVIENGSRFSESSTDITVPNSNFTGVIDICGGTVQMDGDCTTAIAWHISNGNIKSHGSSSGVSNYYDSNTGKTYITSTPVTNYWIGGSGTDWHTAANWSEGYFPVYSSSEKAYLGMNATGGYTVDFDMAAGVDYSPGDFYLGRDVDPAGTYTFNVISPGVVYDIYSYIGSQGVLNIDGGDYITFGTKQLNGIVNVNDGIYKNRSYVWRIDGRLNLNAGSTLIFYNGSRFSETSTNITVPNSYFTGIIDICGGEMQMQGDCTTALASHISSGNIRSHGSTSGVDCVYDPNSNKTYVTSTPVTNYWIGGSGTNWHTAANWSEGYVPVYSSSEKAYLGMNATGDYTVDFTQWVSYDGSPADFYLGRDVDPSGTYTLNLSSTGFISNVYSYIGSQGVINVNGGRYWTFGTKSMNGTVNINDGAYVNRSYVWRIGGYVAVNSGSTLVIYNGTRFSESSTDITVPNSYFTGVIDLCGGTMQMDGDCTTAIEWHIKNGNIKSHGRSSGLNCYYSSGKTYVISSAYNEYPVDGDEYVMNGTVDLVWETDDEVDSCDVYFGTSQGSLTYQANTTAGTWTCPTLTTGQQYYWRIDTVEGSTTRPGKVWSFKVADTPLGLYVEYDATLGRNIVKHDGSHFKGYGVNYITSFMRKACYNPDTSYEEGFEVLSDYNIPFVRVFGGGYRTGAWAGYLNDKEHYFEMFDEVMESAEENNVGVIFSVCFNQSVCRGLMGESIAEWADPNSKTALFIEQYVRELYERYKNCPAFWGWEAGNEYNYFFDQGDPTATYEIRLPQWRQIVANFHNSVRKVDKNRFTTNGFGSRKTVNGHGVDPVIIEDSNMVDVASYHYYGGGRALLLRDLNLINGWGQPLYVGEFGVPEDVNLATNHDGGYATVQEAFEDMTLDMLVDGITFASAWVFDYPTHDGIWNITNTNYRSYMLEILSDANAALNP